MDELDKLLGSPSAAQAPKDELDALLQAPKYSAPQPSPEEMQATVDAQAGREAAASQKKSDDEEFQRRTSFGTLQVPGARPPRDVMEARLHDTDLEKYKAHVAAKDAEVQAQQDASAQNFSGPEGPRKIASTLINATLPGNSIPGVGKLTKMASDFVAGATVPLDDQGASLAKIDAPDEAADAAERERHPLKPSNFILELMGPLGTAIKGVQSAISPKQRRAAVIQFAQGGTLNTIDELAGAVADMGRDKIKFGAGYDQIMKDAYGPREGQSAAEQELRSKYVTALAAQTAMEMQANPTLGDFLTKHMREEVEGSAGAFPVTSTTAQLAGGVALGGVESAALAPTRAVRLLGASTEGAVAGLGMVDNPNATAEDRLNSAVFGLALGVGMAGAFEVPGLLKSRVAPEAELKAVATPDAKRAAANALEAGKPLPWDEVTHVIGKEGTNVGPLPPELADTMPSPNTKETVAGRARPIITAAEPEPLGFAGPAKPRVEAAFVISEGDNIVVKLTGAVEESFPLKTMADAEKIAKVVEGKGVDIAFSDKVLQMLARMDLDSVEVITALEGKRVKPRGMQTDTWEQALLGHRSPDDGWAAVVKTEKGYKLIPGTSEQAAVATMKEAGVHLVTDDVGTPGLAIVSDGIAQPLPDGMMYPTVGKVSSVDGAIPVDKRIVSILRETSGEDTLKALKEYRDFHALENVDLNGPKTSPRIRVAEVTEKGPKLHPEVERVLSKEPLKLRSVELDKKPQFLLSDAMVRKYYGLTDEAAREVFNKATRRARGTGEAPVENVFRPRPEMGGERGLVAVATDAEAASLRVHQAVQAVLADRAAEALAQGHVKNSLPPARIVPPQPVPDIAGYERLSKVQKFAAISGETLLPVSSVAAEFGKSADELLAAAKELGVKLEYQGTYLASKDIATDLQALTQHFKTEPPVPPSVTLNSFVIPPFLNPSAVWKKGLSLLDKLDVAKAISPDNVAAFQKEEARAMMMLFGTVKNNPSAKQVAESTARQMFGMAARAPKWLAQMIVDKKGIDAAMAARGEILHSMELLFGNDSAVRKTVGEFITAPPGPKRDAALAKLTADPKHGPKVGQMLEAVRSRIDRNSAEIKRRTGIDVMATPTDEAMQAYSVRMYAAYLLKGGEHQAALVADTARLDRIVAACVKDTKLSPDEARNLVLEVAQGPLHQMDPLASSGKAGGFRQSLKSRKDLPQWYRDALGEVKDGPIVIAHTIARQNAILRSADMWDHIATDTRFVERTPQPPVPYGRGNFAAWQKLENNPARFGKAAGTYIHPAAYEVLVNQKEASQAALGIVRELIGIQKSNQIALGGMRPITTGTLGNAVMAMTGNIMRPGHLSKFKDDMVKAARAIVDYRKNAVVPSESTGPVFDAMKYGALAPALSTAETHLAEQIFRDSVEAAAKDGTDVGAFLVRGPGKAYNAYKKFGARAAEFYDAVTDRWWKTASFIHMRDRAVADPSRWLGVDSSSHSPAEIKDLASKWAALECRKSFPYPDDVGRAVDAARKNALGIGATYLTYAAEDARIWSQLPGRMANDPGHAANFAVWGGALLAAGAGVAALRDEAGITQEECDAAAQAQGSQRSAGLVCLPFRDTKTDRPMLVDVSNYFGPLRFMQGVNGDKDVAGNLKQIAANVATAPVAGGFAERPVREVLGPALGTEVFGYSLDKKPIPGDDAYIQMLQTAASAGALPRGIVQFVEDRRKMELLQPQAPMSQETFWARELLGLNVPRSVTEQEARQRVVGDLFRVQKDMKSVVRSSTQPVDVINGFMNTDAKTLKERRMENMKRQLKEVQEKRSKFEATQKAAKEK